MGNNVKKRFTVSLDIETKDLEKQVKGTVSNLKTILADLGSASDKMGYFKELVEYIGQIDSALVAMRSKNKDAFSHMFDGLDAGLKQEFEKIFGVAKDQLGVLDQLKDKLAVLKSSGSASGADLKPLEQEVISLYESIGMLDKLDMSGKGKIESRIKKLEEALEGFAIVFENVNAKIGKGLNFGGLGSRKGNVDGRFGKLSEEVQAEIDELKKQQQELQEIIDAINNPKKVNVKLSKNSTEQVEQLKSLKQAFLDAASAKNQLEVSKMTGTDEYLAAVAKYVKAAAELKSAFESNDLTDKGMNWVNINATTDLEDADKVLDSFLKKNEAVMNKVQDMYADKMGSISDQIEFLAKPYDTLVKKVKEYASLQNTINRGTNLSEDEEDEIYDKVDALEKYFVTLDKVGSKKQEIKQLLGKLTFGDVDAHYAIEELCNLLGVQIPVAAKKAEAALGSINTNSAVVGSTSVDKNSNANAIVENVNETTSALEYAKTELVKAWQGYYHAVQDAMDDGIDVMSGFKSSNMEKQEGIIQDMLNAFGIQASNQSAWGITTDLDLSEYIVDGDIGFDSIAKSIESLFAQYGVSFSASIEEMKAKMSGFAKESPQEVVAAMDVVETKTNDVFGSFQDLVNYISQSGKTPGTMFDKLESGAQIVDEELKSILQSLNLIDAAGNINFSSINSGYTNQGGFVSDQYTMIARKIIGDWGQKYFEKSQKLQSKLADAKNAGAQVGEIVELIKDETSGLFYEFQKTVPGEAAFSHHNYSANSKVLNASDEQLGALVKTMQALSQNGLFIDFGGDNILYDKDNGFSIIDLGLAGGQNHTVSKQNTLQENIDRFVQQYLSFAENSNLNKDIIQDVFVNKLYDIAHSIDTSVINPSDPNKYASQSNVANQKNVASLSKEESAHKQNADAIEAENAALKEQIDLKQKAQSMTWKEFATDSSLIDAKSAAGLYTLGDMEQFWKKAKYEKDVDFHELSQSEINDMLAKHGYVTSGDGTLDDLIKANGMYDLISSWYGGAHFPQKPKWKTWFWKTKSSEMLQ